MYGTFFYFYSEIRKRNRIPKSFWTKGFQIKVCVTVNRSVNLAYSIFYLLQEYLFVLYSNRCTKPFLTWMYQAYGLLLFSDSQIQNPIKQFSQRTKKRLEKFQASFPNRDSQQQEPVIYSLKYIYKKKCHCDAVLEISYFAGHLKLIFAFNKESEWSLVRVHDLGTCRTPCTANNICY